MSVSANVHVEPGSQIQTYERSGSHWVHVGGAGVFFRDPVDAERMAEACNDLARQMRAAAHLPEPEPLEVGNRG